MRLLSNSAWHEGAPPVRISCISSVWWALRQPSVISHQSSVISYQLSVRTFPYVEFSAKMKHIFRQPAQDRQSAQLIAPSFVLFVSFVVNSVLFLLCSFAVKNPLLSQRTSPVRRSFSGCGHFFVSLSFVLSVGSLRSLWQNLFSFSAPLRFQVAHSITPRSLLVSPGNSW